MLLLGIALTGVAYPLWWDHRSNSAGHALLQRALHPAALRAGRVNAATSCPLSSRTRAFPATPRRPGVLEIPAIGLRAPVLGGVTNAVLDVAVGHDPATVWPGGKGESVLLAHDVSYFSGLDRVRPGATIVWQAGCEAAVFSVVASTVTRPGATLPTPPSGSGLALVTCWPTNALFWTPERYVVEAELVARHSIALPMTIPPPSLPQLVVPAPPALAAEGLSLARSGIPLGHLTIAGSPSRSFREGPQPLVVANAALRDFAAAAKAAAAENMSWWSALAIAGVPLPQPWALYYDTNVTLVVNLWTVNSIVLSSPVVTVTLTIHNGVLLVAAVRAL